MLMLLSTLTFAQQKVVTGKVVDAQGQPVPFATVRIKGARGGVSADADGNFSIKATAAQTLVISGAGIMLKEVPVGEGSSLVIQVTRQNSSLDEVVVTALGVRRSRNSLPYAAQQISGDEITKTITTNVVNNLSGKIAGLQITASNAMGGASNVILRGWRSLTQSNQALFIIDGVPYDNTTTTGSGYDFGNATQDLNPDDIASMSVLKGAAASALYGTRGNNGVILVTTKRGSDRKTTGVLASFGFGVGHRILPRFPLIKRNMVRATMLPSMDLPPKLYLGQTAALPRSLSHRHPTMPVPVQSTIPANRSTNGTLSHPPTPTFIRRRPGNRPPTTILPITL